jgi:hypothetical protein
MPSFSVTSSITALGTLHAELPFFFAASQGFNLVGQNNTVYGKTDGSLTSKG